MNKTGKYLIRPTKEKTYQVQIRLKIQTTNMRNERRVIATDITDKKVYKEMQ